MVIRVYTKIHKNELKPHEGFNSKHYAEISSKIIKNGYIVPIIIDHITKIILDGHHRFEFCKNHNIDYIPVFEVDYQSSDVVLKTWNGLPLTKNDVIDSGMNCKLLPPKTSRHIVKVPSQKILLEEIK